MKKSLFLILFIFTQTLLAKSLLVSDIDDTIKISYVLSKLGVVSNGKRINNEFARMGEFYRELNTNIPDLEFVYLSNGPKTVVQWLHSTFLWYNQFPAGQLMMRSQYSVLDHKIQSLRNILNSQLYDQVILVGDNGERDILVYDQIRQEFPHVNFYVYIHLVYGTQASSKKGLALKPQQLGYVTPIDIIYDLSEKNIISQNSAVALADRLIPELMSAPLDEDEGPLTFAEWQDCSDYQWSISNFPAVQISAFKNFVQRRCH